jgi:DNA-binding MarR family transcriptional regulator
MQPDENDRRNKIISLTKKGQALVNKIHREAKSQVQQALHLMTDEEKNIVAAGLTIYARALKQARIKKEKQ